MQCCGWIAWGFMDCTGILGLHEDCMDFVSILLWFGLLTREPCGVPPLSGPGLRKEPILSDRAELGEDRDPSAILQSRCNGTTDGPTRLACSIYGGPRVDLLRGDYGIALRLLWDSGLH